MKVIELRDQLIDSWRCNRRVATLAARYYLGIDSEADLTTPTVYGRSTGSALLTQREMNMIKELR